MEHDLPQVYCTSVASANDKGAIDIKDKVDSDLKEWTEKNNSMCVRMHKTYEGAGGE